MSLTFGSWATKSGIIVFVQQSQSGTLEASLLILIMTSSFCEYNYYSLIKGYQFYDIQKHAQGIPIYFPLLYGRGEKYLMH